MFINHGLRATNDKLANDPIVCSDESLIARFIGLVASTVTDHSTGLAISSGQDGTLYFTAPEYHVI